jgi:hypothetical protein
VAFGRRRRRRSTEDESPVEEGKRGNGCAGRVGVGREDDDDEIGVIYLHAIKKVDGYLRAIKKFADTCVP